MSKLGSIFEKMRRVQEEKKSDYQLLIDKANRVRAEQEQLEKEEKKPEIEVIPWKPELYDERGNAIRVSVVNGKLSRVYQRGGTSRKGGCNSSFTWSSNSASYLEIKKLENRSWRLRYEACKIPNERALILIGAPIALLSQFASQR